MLDLSSKFNLEEQSICAANNPTNKGVLNRNS